MRYGQYEEVKPAHDPDEGPTEQRDVPELLVDANNLVAFLGKVVAGEKPAADDLKGAISVARRLSEQMPSIPSVASPVSPPEPDEPLPVQTWQGWLEVATRYVNSIAVGREPERGAEDVVAHLDCLAADLLRGVKSEHETRNLRDLGGQLPYNWSRSGGRLAGGTQITSQDEEEYGGRESGDGDSIPF